MTMKRVYKIKPTPFKCNGVTYRSKLEAKYACFFDFYDYDYQYEPLKFYYDENDSSKYYTPDFTLAKDRHGPKSIFFNANRDFIIEVKPTIPNEIEIKKALNSIVKYGLNETDFEFVFCIGDPFDHKYLCFKTQSYVIDSCPADLKYLPFVDNVFLKIKSLENIECKKFKKNSQFYFYYKNIRFYCNEIACEYPNFWTEACDPFDCDNDKYYIDKELKLSLFTNEFPPLS